jgi:hypothetical protein
MSAQLDMAKALGVTPPSYIADILAHLTPFNTASEILPPRPPPPPPPPAPVNCSDTGHFTDSEGQRCQGDDGMGRADTVECCQARCNADPGCDAFSYCESADCGAGPPPFIHNCWKYPPGAKCAAGAGFVSGHRVHALRNVSEAGIKTMAHRRDTPAAVAAATTEGAEAEAAVAGGPEKVWVAYANAWVRSSDGFALYPLWPSEMIGLDADDDSLKVARASLEAYPISAGGINARPVLAHMAAVRAGGCPAGTNSSTSACRSSSDVLADLLQWINSDQKPSFIPDAPGGGTENVGVTQVKSKALFLSVRREVFAVNLLQLTIRTHTHTHTHTRTHTHTHTHTHTGCQRHACSSSQRAVHHSVPDVATHVRRVVHPPPHKGRVRSLRQLVC